MFRYFHFFHIHSFSQLYLSDVDTCHLDIFSLLPVLVLFYHWFPKWHWYCSLILIYDWYVRQLKTCIKTTSDSVNACTDIDSNKVFLKNKVPQKKKKKKKILTDNPMPAPPKWLDTPHCLMPLQHEYHCLCRLIAKCFVCMLEEMMCNWCRLLLNRFILIERPWPALVSFVGVKCVSVLNFLL